MKRDISAAVDAPDAKSKLRALNMDAHASTPEQTAELLASETKRWGEVIVRAKVAAQ